MLFFRAQTSEERKAINSFLQRHNPRGAGSNLGYVACYAVVAPQASPSSDNPPLVDRIVAAAKFCPLHTPQAARFFGGKDWRHVYCLQRLAAIRMPANRLSEFLGFCLREIGQDKRVWYVATYADTTTFNDQTSRPHDGGIYRATNAVYCGLSKGGVEGFVLNGQRYSMRRGPKTFTLAELKAINAQARSEGRPELVKIIRSSGMHRYCWPVGTPLKRAARRLALERRMSHFKFEAMYQPRLLSKLRLVQRFAGQAA